MSLEDKLYPLLSIYDRLPQSAKWTIGFAYRRIPERFRRGKNYREFKNLAEEGESWSREEIEAYQLKELRKTLHQANAYCPYYQERFAQVKFRPENFRSLEDLKCAPLLEKRDLLEQRDRLASTQVPAKSRLYITTGGSTGVPVGFYLQKGISRAKEHAFLETMWKRGGYFDGARLALLRGYVTSDRAAGKISTYDATRDWLVLSSYHLTPERLPLYLAELRRFKPDLLYVYPSAILQLAEYLQQSGTEWDLPLRGILCGSERITAPQKELIRQVFHCRAYSWYGHSERVVLAAEGRNTDLLYFVPQYGYVEFGPPNEDGLQEVIGTSFHNMAMPLIRYRTGDYVRVVKDDSNLEFPWPAISEVAGREQEFLVSGTGRKISLTAFNMHDRIFDGLYAVQFYQERPGEAEFRYIAGPG
ncbi:MAG: phenylacetate--CoA ligase family protein, partial [Verrucomicrobiota bacterium]